MNKNVITLLVTFVVISLLSCKYETSPINQTWCEQEIRSQFNEHEEISTASSWFKVYNVGDNVLAIAEPYNYQEVISYLIMGEDRALLFDTGMGLDSMSLVVNELTDLPITVLNSHTHYDHIGSNHEFHHILAFDTAYTRKYARDGWPHDLVKHEVGADAFCSNHLPDRNVNDYHIQPFNISEFIFDRSEIDLGNRNLEVISVPGHTPDAIALLDKGNGYLWTGDTFYEAAIWLFFEGTDLKAYQKSVNKLSALTTHLKRIFPAHNTPVSSPERLIDLQNAFDDILSGKKQPKPKEKNAHPEDNNALVFEFEHFSFLIGKKYFDR